MRRPARASPSAIEGRIVHVYFHDWDLTERDRALTLRAVLTLLGRRCERSDLDELADAVTGDAPELSFAQ